MSLFVAIPAVAIEAEADTVSVDSVPVALNELVVQGRRAWFEGEKAVFVPTRQEKNLSHDPATLLQSMRLPVLTERDGVFTNRLGEQVTYFINGVRATETDLAAFYTKDVRRVEYLESPTAAEFEGCRAVINIITAQYAVGGVVQAEANVKAPNLYCAEVAGKAAYKRMTFGAMLYFFSYSNHQISDRGEELYRDVFYNGVHYDEIRRLTDTYSWDRSRDLFAVFDARYKTDNFRATHTLKVNYSIAPGNGSRGSEVWTPDDIFDATTSESNYHGKNNTVFLRGHYQAELPRNWTLAALWNYGYARNRGTSWSRLGELAPITTSTDEDVHSARFAVSPMFRPSSKLYFALIASGTYEHYTTDYSGSAATRAVQWRFDSDVNLTAIWSPRRNLQFRLHPGMLLYYSDWGSESRHTVRPNVNFYAYWSISDKLSISGSESYYNRAPESSETADVTVRQSELMWLRGNPMLGNRESWRTVLSLTWMTNRWLTLSGGFSYSNDNDYYTNYAAAPVEMGGIIKEMADGIRDNSYLTSLQADVSLFSNKLKFSVTPYWRYRRFNGLYAGTQHNVRCDVDISYTLHKCRFSFRYEAPSRYLSDGGMIRGRSDDFYNFNFTYGNGDLFLRLRVENFFERHRTSWERLTTSHFSSDMDKFRRGISAGIDITYTFGFGRRVDYNIDINSGSSMGTSVLGGK